MPAQIAFPAPKQMPLYYRAWSLLLNILATLVAAPLLLIVGALLLVLNPFLNPGPLMFCQRRVGLGGNEFVIWKFRTMAPPEPEHETTLIHMNEHRISRFGRLVRKFRLDELPNFLNVIAGDMNAIGPRPDAVPQAMSYVGSVERYADRFRVKPGITGVAQVMHGYAACESQTRIKARYDQYYVENQRVRLDFLIVMKTIRVVLTGFGSR